MFLNESLRGFLPYTPGEQPKDMARLIKLNTNENPFPPSPMAVEAITKSEIEGLRLYSDPDCARLIEAIAGFHCVSEEMIFPGNGSDEVLALIFHGMCENGAAFPDITYGFYRVFAELFGVRYTEIPLKADFSVAVDDYADFPGTVFLANPNAPTGICLPLTEVERLLRQNTRRLVVVDEAYVEFGGESAEALLGEYDNLIVVRTFSKSHSLAGARIGYAVSSAETIKELNTLKFSFNPYNINRLSIILGAAAMRDREYFEDCRSKVIENRDYITHELKNLGFNVLESKANFIFAGDNPKISGEKFYLELRQRGILVRYFNIPRISSYVRITIGTREQMQALVCAAKETVK